MTLRLAALSILICSLAVLSTGPSWASVSERNGNYWKSYVDISIPGTKNRLEIKRTYNSVSTYQSWFGIGWANKYETSLSFRSDGAIIIHQGGAGTKLFLDASSYLPVLTFTERQWEEAVTNSEPHALDCLTSAPMAQI